MHELHHAYHVAVLIGNLWYVMSSKRGLRPRSPWPVSLMVRMAEKRNFVAAVKLVMTASSWLCVSPGPFAGELS